MKLFNMIEAEKHALHTYITFTRIYTHTFRGLLGLKQPMEAPHSSRAVTACLSRIKASSGSKNDKVMLSLRTISGGLIGISLVLWRLRVCAIELMWRPQSRTWGTLKHFHKCQVQSSITDEQEMFWWPLISCVLSTSEQ